MSWRIVLELEFDICNIETFNGMMASICTMHTYRGGKAAFGVLRQQYGGSAGIYGAVSFTIDHMFYIVYWYSHFLRVIYHFNLMGHKFLPEIK